MAHWYVRNARQGHAGGHVSDCVPRTDLLVALEHLKVRTEDYASELNAQFTYLFDWARSIGEVDMAASLFGEFRGSQDGGWSTTITAYEVRDELQSFNKRGEKLSVAELRQVLCLYSQLSEAGGVYEGLLNLIGVVKLKPYNLWPFRDLVRVTQSPKRVIGPNANAMFRRLAKAAAEIGMNKFAELLEITFRDDIRNAMFHADYIIATDGLRLRRRNGGQVSILKYQEINRILTNALNFFQLLEDFQRTSREAYRPAKQIVGRFSLNPPMPHTIALKPDGSFSISTNGIGKQTDSNYDRQERINNMLHGRVVAAYLNVNDEGERSTLENIRSAGFDPAVISTSNEVDRAVVLNEIVTHGLWRFDHEENGFSEGLLLATPSGFTRIASREAFFATLPIVEALEFERN